MNNKTTNNNERNTWLFTRFLVLIFLVWSVPKITQAQLIAYEGFNYPALTDGASIADANAGTGWTEAWNSDITATEGAYQATGLSYDPLINEGGALKWNSNRGQYGRAFDATAGGTIDLSSGGTAWFSVIARFDDGIDGRRYQASVILRRRG